MRIWVLGLCLASAGVILYFLVRAIISDVAESTAREAEQKCRDENSRRIVRVIEHGPLFYEMVQGNILVLVRRLDYLKEYAKWVLDVSEGRRKSHDPIMLMVAPAFTFYKDEARRHNLTEVGSWKDADKIKLEAMRLASGLSESEFEDATKGNTQFWSRYKGGYYKKILNGAARPTDQLFVPFAYSRPLTFERQEEIFGKHGLQSAREILLEGITPIE